ncbi:hypothetical protein [Algihabitans sp.]|uniref:hypothetical protein n=1 Tax=Algihabitans sp. TaxID=2821514 RepID=UPI003BA99021
MARLTYVYDPLCGWCFGFVPTLRAFAETNPEVEIDVVPGGLVTGDRVGPYGNMLGYITGAAPRMTATTGQALGDAFFDMMRQEETPLSTSAPPSLAALQMQKLTDKAGVLRFVHCLLEAHFINGNDLNRADTYDALCKNLDLPQLDTDAIVGATDMLPPVAASYKKARSLGVSFFPTSVVYDNEGQNRGAITGIYDAKEFQRAFEALT